MKYLINAFWGFCMALADSVPGVSGGTIAFILGFYDKFINALNDVFYGDFAKKKSALWFLFKLGTGWVVGVGLATLVLTSLFESKIYAVSSLFLGFIIFSIPLIIKEEKDNLKGNYKNIIFSIIGILVVSLITYFNPMTGSSGVNIANLNFGLVLYILVAGMIAISAMVLPGISGSTLLLIFGLYIPIINGIKEFLHFNFTYFPALFCFGIGVLLGIALVIKLIKHALDKHRSATVYLIIGLMIGSLYAIIMGPTTLEVPKDAMSFDTFSILFFIIGGLVIMGLEKIKEILEKKHIEG